VVNFNENAVLRMIMSERLHNEIEKEVKDIAKELGVSEHDLKVFRYDFIPMRIQHIVYELAKRGYILIETLISNGELIVIALRKSNKELRLVPDYNID